MDAPVLVVNAGSTSLKLSVVSPSGETVVPAGLEDVHESIGAVGHRVVHGGTRFREPVLLDEGVKPELETLSQLAPLHNAPALAAIAEAERAFPHVPHVAVFDTAFHATIPPEASTYPLPARWREEWGVRRYGFHGLSVQWVASRVRASRLVVCHLGGGCSLTAVRDGRSVDTTMGFTPLEGVPMATRSGSVDPGILLHALRERGLTADELARTLERESGLAALGGLEDPLALGVFVHRVAAAAAAMAAALGGLDALAFTGGIGENRPEVRDGVTDRLRFLGDFRVEVVPAREDLVIAAAVRELLADS
jgi:acetate kinase